MKYVLQDLLTLRERRVDSARSEVRWKRIELQRIREEIQRKKRELEEYIKWRIETEDNLYLQIKNKVLSQRELEEVRTTVSLLRERELSYVKALEESRKAEKEKIRELEDAKSRLNEILRSCEKIKEHKKIWIQEMKREIERKQDIEMEEFGIRKGKKEIEDVY